MKLLCNFALIIKKTKRLQMQRLLNINLEFNLLKESDLLVEDTNRPPGD
jgi:hypothetical protein